MVSHKAVLFKLEKSGLGMQIINVICGLFTDRKHCVIVDGFSVLPLGSPLFLKAVSWGFCIFYLLVLCGVEYLLSCLPMLMTHHHTLPSLPQDRVSEADVL